MNSARKGFAGERELVVKLADLGFEAERNIQRYVGGRGNPDISLPGIHLEVKRTEKLRLHDAMIQATMDSRPTGDTPVVMSRRNRDRWLVTMYLDDWAELYKAFTEGGNGQ